MMLSYINHNPKMSISKAYNAWANQYDSNQNKTRDLDKIATKNTLSNYTFNRVLELGCGTGKNTTWLVGTATEIIGIDFSKEMLEKAKTKITDKKVRFIQGDLKEKWQVSDNYFNLITCSLTLEHIQDLETIFKQAVQKLKKEGLFFICELHPFKQYTGSKARFETKNGTQTLEVYTHHITKYLQCAKRNNLKLMELNEWFDSNNKNEIPRLVSFVFKK